MRGIFSLFAVFSVGLSSTAIAQSREAIDLDHAAPAEILVDNDPVMTVLYWSAPNSSWLELFRSESGIEGFTEDPQSSLKQIKSGGRYWQWRDDAYVPLVADEAIFSGGLEADVYEQAVQFIGGFEDTPENTPGNVEVSVDLEGPQTTAALLGGTVFCSLGGTNCPVVFFKDGEPVSAAYVTVNQPWGIARQVNENGFPYIEAQLDRSLLIIDSETGEEVEIEGISPRLSDLQPQAPRDVQQ